MKNLANGWLPSLAVALVLGGCGSIERRPETVVPGAAIGTAATDASAGPTHAIRNADP